MAVGVVGVRQGVEYLFVLVVTGSFLSLIVLFFFLSSLSFLSSSLFVFYYCLRSGGPFFDPSFLIFSLFLVSFGVLVAFLVPLSVVFLISLFLESYWVHCCPFSLRFHFFLLSIHPVFLVRFRLIFFLSFFLLSSCPVLFSVCFCFGSLAVPFDSCFSGLVFFALYFRCFFPLFGRGFLALLLLLFFLGY